MLSRVADSLFWMARYLERAEHTARVLNVHLNLMLEQQREVSVGRWDRVRRSLGMEAHADPDTFVQTLAFDLKNRSSVVASVMAARDNARQVREQISSEMWEQLNRLFHEVRRSDGVDTLDFLGAVKDGAHLFMGLTDATMSHGEGWQFIQIGRALERALNITMLVETHFDEFESPDEMDYLEWIGLLKCATAFEAYCKEYTAEIDPRRVAEFLLLNPEFPHSLRFSVNRLHEAITVLSEGAPSRRSARLQRLAGRLKAQLDYAQADEILAHGLRDFLEDARKQGALVYAGVYQAYIRYPVETALEA